MAINFNLYEAYPFRFWVEVKKSQTHIYFGRRDDGSGGGSEVFRRGYRGGTGRGFNTAAGTSTARATVLWFYRFSIGETECASGGIGPRCAVVVTC